MRRLAALLRTCNDGLRIGRCLETLYPCDEILVIDNGSTDQTLRIAREYGARIVAGDRGQQPIQGLAESDTAWLLCLDARESLTEALAASLFEWKSGQPVSEEPGIFSVVIREETGNGWAENPREEIRLVPVDWQRWNGHWPRAEQRPITLTGELLRFSFP
jgi:glycosyltransferase involved in cell wall biosynthesis